MVVGQRIDQNKIWQLGDISIGETNAYKYLGVMFTRALADSYHIENVLLQKSRRLQGYIGCILGRHDNIKRVEFGDVLWTKVVLPSILHGSGAWLDNTMTSKKRLRSIQYKIACSVLQVKASPAFIATIGDLGWLPLSVEAERLRVKYFHYLKFKTSENRLCKIVFDDMYVRFKGNRSSKYSWPYFKEIQSALNKAGMDWVMDSDDPSWIKRFDQLRKESFKAEFLSEIDAKSSLEIYRCFKVDFKAEPYLRIVSDFQGAQNKFRARTGTLGLKANTKVWGISNGICDMCQTEEEEDVSHILFACPHYRNLRMEVFNSLESLLEKNRANYVWEHFMASSILTKLSYLIGDFGLNHSNTVFEIFDSIGRKFLKDVLCARRVFYERQDANANDAHASNG